MSNPELQELQELEAEEIALIEAMSMDMEIERN